jgi:PAS domain S-box-containing protein
VARGRLIYTTNCVTCHGPDARGGSDAGADLIASTIAFANDNGVQLAAFLKVGRPERRMPPFALADADVVDLWTFLRSIAPGGRGGGGRGMINAIVVGDPDGTIREVNPAACRLFGYAAEELLGRNGRDFTAPEWLAVVEQRAVRKLSGLESVSVYESVVVDRMGNRIPVEIRSTPVRADGEIVSMHAVMHDLTERKRTETALRESEERFRLAFESAPIGIALVAVPEGRWLRVNGALCALLGYEPGELVGVSFRELTHPDDLGADLARAEAMLRGELGPYEVEKRYLRKDGTVMWAQVNASLVFGANGEPIYSIAQIQDITARKGAELRAAQARRREADAGPLTPREREVLGLLAEGLTSAEAASQLGLTAETIETHVRRALRKLDARSRTHAVALALRLGLLEAPPTL